ncbi:ChrR family anti-sigma-E factor [Azospirillum sp. TSO22-1]|uniref:ChrR family anti-sigma-E factor n=1 Tax=Azospirillum sp. TSO22-1 TaxID=716789 RepID=UPI000D618753|nr:ChrR family anti-sigma-E factor [Azospirillum sp. TSO22-1]PWC56148.1 hypothetical protein TSO221_02595 [Azospirillum sp. TSO22-1]
MGLPGHHPQDDLLFGYAGGGLREARSLLVATHLAYCPSCRERVAAFEAQCGAWFDETPSVSADGHLDAILERLHGRLGAEPRASVPPPRPRPATAEAVPEPLRSWLDGPVRDRVWTAMVPGVWVSSWSRGTGGSLARLLRMAPGVTVPAHRHEAAEMLLVLEGAFRDEYGRFRLGDLIQYEPGSDHHATGDEAGECICLLLVEGEVVFLDEPGPTA